MTDIEKQLSQIVCICKGINLRRVLKSLMKCNSVYDVNQSAGTGSGGCQGRRCGPRIRTLLEKKKNLPKDNSPESHSDSDSNSDSNSDSPSI